MAQTFCDFNVDGKLDILMTGMTSPTVNRLEHLKLIRGGASVALGAAARMANGNKLLIANRSKLGFGTNTLSESIRNSGWSWGCSALDFDNDGFPDVYIANGLETRAMVHDYESEYWLHDKFIGKSESDSTAYHYFKNKFARTRGRGQSYGGFEKNRLFWNRHGAFFLEIGFLLGVALEEDSRNVVSDDLNGDGRVDIVVTSFASTSGMKQKLRVYENRLSDAGNWIGFRCRESANGISLAGLEAEIKYGEQRSVQQIVFGDSYRSQHSLTFHFGLGKVDDVDSVTIRWPGGQVETIWHPKLNKYHSLSSVKRDAKK
jgi:hypothetical protein